MRGTISNPKSSLNYAICSFYTQTYATHIFTCVSKLPQTLLKQLKHCHTRENTLKITLGHSFKMNTTLASPCAALVYRLQPSSIFFSWQYFNQHLKLTVIWPACKDRKWYQNFETSMYYNTIINVIPHYY